ncbi:hypothetical protein [Streptomyces sp. JL7001]|uniref:hypothetical protein n=1 Tax=Streptomyces sp. JL7001 TaxID=3445784 RepID=UPI003F798331
MTETSWIVELRESYWSDVLKDAVPSKTHLRISVGELEHEHDTPAAVRPAKGRLRRALGGS